MSRRGIPFQAQKPATELKLYPGTVVMLYLPRDKNPDWPQYTRMYLNEAEIFIIANKLQVSVGKTDGYLRDWREKHPYDRKHFRNHGGTPTMYLVHEDAPAISGMFVSNT